VDDLYAAALGRNREEFEAMGRSLQRGASKPQRAAIARLRSNPAGHWLCGWSASWQSLARPRPGCAPAPRIPSHPAKTLARRRGDRQRAL